MVDEQAVKGGATFAGTVVHGIPTALYRLYDAGGQLLYVGIAANPGGRWTQHASTQTWWPQVSTKTLAWFPTRREALDAESVAIRSESPAYNAARPRDDEVTTRSWYMSKAAAERLKALIDDTHFATRLPKHLIMEAAVNVLGLHEAEIESEARTLGADRH